MTKRLIPRRKLTNRQISKLIALFTLEVPAIKAAHVVGVNRHSAERVYQVIRCHLARECERRSPLRGEVAADESYFGGHRKDWRGRGAAAKVRVFGILERRGRVSVTVVPNVTAQTLMQETVKIVKRGTWCTRINSGLRYPHVLRLPPPRGQP